VNVPKSWESKLGAVLKPIAAFAFRVPISAGRKSIRQEVVNAVDPDLRPTRHWVVVNAGCGSSIIVLFGLLAGLKVRPHWCAIAGASTAVAVAIIFFKMPPTLAALSFGYGVAFGVLKIAWIVLAAVYLYDISVETGPI